MIEYTRKINSFLCRKDEKGENIVVAVYWSITGTDGDISHTITGGLKIPFREGEPIIPFSELTESRVLKWVAGTLGAERINEIEQNILKIVEKSKNPPYFNMAPPWTEANTSVELTPWMKQI